MRVFRTNEKEHVFLEETKPLNQEYDCMKAVHIYEEHKYQTWKGFGGAFTEAAGYTWSKLTQAAKQELIDAYFGPNGIGYSFCRLHINSCDFALGNYAYLEQEPDENWSNFNIDRDKQYMLPLVKEAMMRNGTKMTFLSTPWSPPAFMKTNGEMNNGGKLKQEYAKLWATYIAKYIKEYEKEGIHISYITVQNEPLATQTWDSCIYTAKEEQDFVRDYLAPTLQEEGLGEVKILIWDHNKELVYERAKEVLSDEKVREQVAGIAFHWYTGDHFEGLSLVGESFPEKELIFTEGCVEYSRFADNNETQKAMMYAHDMIGNLNHGANGFIDWNLLLDEKGGPNHVGNYCAAPIMADTKMGSIEKRLAYYYIGHFSKFIKPGARRIASTKYTRKLELTAFENPDGKKVLVVLNTSEDEVSFSMKEKDTTASFCIQPQEIMSIEWE